MAKKIKPHKLVIEFDDNGEFRNGVLVYQLEIDGSTDRRKYYTMAIKDGVDGVKMTAILKDAKAHVKKGEGITDGVG